MLQKFPCDMDDLEIEANEGGIGVNFIPCLTWVRRGVAKANPEQVKLTKEDLAKIIDETTSGINQMEVEDEDDSEDEQDQEENGIKQEADLDVDIKQEQESDQEVKKEMKVEEEVEQQEDDDDDEDDINKKYGLDNYDDDEENNGSY